MPSFDVVSEVDRQEVDNAINQARKEIANRFDFRDAKATIETEPDVLKLSAKDAYKLEALEEVIRGKLAKRNVPLRNIERVDENVSPLGYARATLKIKQGIDGNVAKDIVAAIKSKKMKVQAAIQERHIRVTGKKRDDLQQVMTFLRGGDWPVELSYNNFRN